MPPFPQSPLTPASPSGSSASFGGWRFAFLESLWLLREAIVLVWNMGFGLRWMFMSIRIILYGLVLAPGFLKVIWWYMNSPCILRRVPYRRPSSHVGSQNNRAYMDIHFPVTVTDLLMASVRGSGKSGNGEMLANSILTTSGATPKEKYPVIVCVGGGAWIIGSHYWSAMLAWMLTRVGYIVVTPDYRNFPQATMSEMVSDVEDAIVWVMENIGQFRGDLNDITLLGQSAGAHLCFLAVVRQLERLQRGEETRFAPKKLRKLIGLSGIYNLITLRNYVDRRGLYKQVLYKLCEGKHNLETFSPELRFGALSATLLREHLPPIELIHGKLDKSAPLSQSQDFVATICGRCGEDGARLTEVATATHTTPLVEDMLQRKTDLVALMLRTPRRVAVSSVTPNRRREDGERSLASPSPRRGLDDASFSALVGRLAGTSEADWSADSHSSLVSDWQVKVALVLSPF